MLNRLLSLLAMGARARAACRTLFVLAALHGAQCAVAAPDNMAERMRACAGCHGAEGRATGEGFFPRIAGKPAGYLYAQLLHFREGRRQHATMAYLIEHMSDAYLRDIAQYFASLQLPYAPPPRTLAPATLLTRGEQLVRHGDVLLRVPACTGCHGAAMTGVAPAVPGLLGLPRDYLLAQLGAWRAGVRRAAAPDCMGEIARRLSAQDVSAVAAWLSSQPMPLVHAVDHRQQAPVQTPIECGRSLP